MSATAQPKPEPAFLSSIARLVAWSSVAIFTALFLDVLLGVFSRYVVGHQVRWTEAMATFLLIWLVFLGSVIAYRENAHLGIDLLVKQFSPEARRLALRLVHLMVLAFALFIMVYGGFALTVDRWQSGQMLPTLGIRKAWLFLAVPVSGLLISLFACAKIVRPEGSAADEEGVHS